MSDTLRFSGPNQRLVTDDHRLVNTHKPSASETCAMLGIGRVAAADAPALQSDLARLQRAAWAFTTRRVPQHIAQAILPPVGTPRAGDLVLARVDFIGHHAGLQLANGRRRHMFIGDEIVVVYGNRYASSQFESLVPKTLGPCHLVAGGGVASRVVSWHARIAKGPTHITPLGIPVDAEGQRINLCDYALEPVYRLNVPHPPTFAIVGTGMDSGKTQTAAYLVRGLIAAGLRVGYAKVTGTGAGGDTWLLKDAGAFPVLDFTDVGLATTYLASEEQIEATLTTLIGHLAHTGVDAIVLEVADGVFQRETAALLRSPVFAAWVGGILLAAVDAMGASAGVNWLSAQSTPVLALSGLLSAAPLQAREAREALQLPVYNREELASASIANQLVERCEVRSDAYIPIAHVEGAERQWV